MQKDNEAVEVIEKKEVPAVKQVGFLNFSALWKFLVENPIFLRRVLMQSNK